MLKAFLPTYASEVLRGPVEYGGRFLLGPHHVEWGEATNKHPRILALAARDHGKSHYWCFAYPLWMADRRAPGKIGYIFSATEQQAIEHLDKIRAEVCGGGEFGPYGNPKLAHLLPLKKDSRKTIKFANGSEIRARGFGTRVRGGHPYWLICDDVGNDDWIWSETVRNKHIDYFLSAIEPMPVPGGQLVVVGTPFHAQDLYNHLEDGGVFHVMKHPAMDEAGKPLWPARYDVHGLELKKKTLNSSLRWSREYLCRPISDESSIFPSSLFEQPGIKQPYRLGQPEFWRQKGFHCFMGVDLALSASAGGDYFVAVVLAVDPQTGDRWLADLVRGKGMSYQEQINTIVSVSELYECGLVFVEANQYQRVIPDMVIRSSSVPVKAFYTTGRGGSKSVSTQRRGMTKTYSANKNALDQGIPTLRMLLENIKLKLPWDHRSRDRVRTLILEMQAFGWAEGKMQGVGAHDDCVMALWIADRAAAIGGAFSVSWDEDDAEDGLDDFFEPFGAASTPAEDDVDFFGTGGDGDWRPREGVGLTW